MALVVMAILPACRRDLELAAGHVTFHDASGRVAIELRATSFGYIWKEHGLRIGAGAGNVDAGEVRSKLDESGGWLEGKKRKVRMEMTGPSGVLRLYDEARAPLGQIERRDDKVWTFAPGGRPLGNAKTDGDRVVLVGREAEALGYVKGLPDEAAALFLLEGFDELERIVLALTRSGAASRQR